MSKGLDKVGKSIEENQITLLLVPGESYNSSLLKLFKTLSKDYSRLLYVALNRPVSKIIGDFKKYRIDEKKFYFIDTITEDASLCKKLKNCEVVAANDLVELSLKVGNTVSKKKPDVVIVDSFHTMEAYQDKAVITRLAHDLIAKLDISGCKGIFPTVRADRDAPLTKDMEMFVDNVAEL